MEEKCKAPTPISLLSGIPNQFKATVVLIVLLVHLGNSSRIILGQQEGNSLSTQVCQQ